MPNQIKKTILISLILSLLVTVSTFASTKSGHKGRVTAHNTPIKRLMLASGEKTTPLSDNAFPSKPTKRAKAKNKEITPINEHHPTTETVFPEIELPALSPESGATTEEIDEGEAIFEQDDTDFVFPPPAEEG